MTCTGTVAGWNLFSAKVTVKPASAAGTATEQGVLQPGPTEVSASAPDGIEFELDLHVGGAGLNESQRKRGAAGQARSRQRQSR